MKTKGILVILSVAMCSLVFWPVPANAKLVTIEIEAEVYYFNDPHNFFEGRIRIGDIITGSYTYESTTPDSNPLDPVLGNYWRYDPPSGISLNVSGFYFGTDPASVEFVVIITNDSPWRGGGLHDVYWIQSNNNLPLSDGTPVDYIYWLLRDHTANAISSDLLPLIPPIVGDWQVNGLWIRGLPNSFFDIGANVTSAIPEPATFFLFFLAGLTMKYERSWINTHS